MTWTEEYFGASLRTKGGSQSTAIVTENKKFVAIYFSAHWCPPCRGFTPVLAEVYDQIRETISEKELEIVFVSSDQDESSFSDYFSHMPWVALPFSERTQAQHLAQKYGVRGIPSLIVLNGATGEIVDADGRSTISSAKGDAEKIVAKWSK